MRMLESVNEFSLNFGSDVRPAEDMLRNMALTMARASAIRRGRLLTSEEMEHLVAQLFMMPDPAFTPNGNPVYTLLDDGAIARLLS